MVRIALEPLRRLAWPTLLSHHCPLVPFHSKLLFFPVQLQASHTRNFVRPAIGRDSQGRGKPPCTPDVIGRRSDTPGASHLFYIVAHSWRVTNCVSPFRGRNALNSFEPGPGDATSFPDLGGGAEESASFGADLTALGYTYRASLLSPSRRMRTRGELRHQISLSL